MKITLIVAVGTNGVIGLDGHMPWHCPEDLQHFQKITMGNPCIAGRRTWESLPNGYLPRRDLMVVSNQLGVGPMSAGVNYSVQGVSSVGQALAKAFELAKPDGRICVIGGANIYTAFMPIAHEIILTHINYDGPGDTYFPEITEEWERVHTAGLTAGVDVSTYARRD